MTIYLFGTMNGYSKLKEIYNYTNKHLKDWYPKLPSYTAFVQRLNKISHLFELLTSKLIKELSGHALKGSLMSMDSMPIIIARQGRRLKARAAKEIASPNGYCATKKLYYYGVKLHLIGKYEVGSLPLPTVVGVTDAGTADIKVLDQIEDQIPAQSKLFGDKAYQRAKEAVSIRENFILFTPVKKEKGQKILDAADRLLSSAISSARQPIESMFNWIEEKTKIQIASKVRSYEGLMVHIYGKLAAALKLLNAKFCS